VSHDQDQDEARSEADAELEREIRNGRPFTLADAIGRMAGPGIMKGVSPVSRREQAEEEIGSWLRKHLTNADGPLGVALLRFVRGSEHLLNNYDTPLLVLAACVQRVLGSEYLLKELVRDSDIEWGRVFGERPCFQREGSPPDPDDPFTVESVRDSLSGLIEKLAEVQV
jgi:hypothetical protein